MRAGPVEAAGTMWEFGSSISIQAPKALGGELVDCGLCSFPCFADDDGFLFSMAQHDILVAR